VLALDFAHASGTEKFLQTFMLEALDHDHAVLS
jgi:hypothetical protein